MVIILQLTVLYRFGSEELPPLPESNWSALHQLLHLKSVIYCRDGSMYKSQLVICINCFFMKGINQSSIVEN